MVAPFVAASAPPITSRRGACVVGASCETHRHDTCYCHDMATTQRSVRVDDEKWAQFKAACATLGTSASAQLLKHIDNTIAHASMIDGTAPTTKGQKST